MKRDFNPVDVELSIENPSIGRGAFYRMCFITESNIAPRTLKVTRLQDLLDNGYSRLDLVYNFCVGVFSQQGMDTIYIRAKRSYESYVEAYNSDDNSMYYFVVLQTKDLTEVEKFNRHLVSSDEMKLQFFSQNVGSKILQSPKLVNYYQDYTLSDGVPVESRDYYLNKAYDGVNAVSKIPLPDYLLEGYGDAAVDYGVGMMVGRDYIWEIDKPNRQVRYARSVVESGWVGSREESTINNSEVTVVATKGRSGKFLRASIKDPKVKIETISRELLKGLGKEVLDYAIPLIDPEANDWVLDPSNNAVKYIVNGGVWSPPQLCKAGEDTGSSLAEVCSNRVARVGGSLISWDDSTLKCEYFDGNGTRNTDTLNILHCRKDPNVPQEKSIPIDTVAQKVISNADDGHLESEEFLKSIPLFAYILTGSGTEAVNKAVLDIDAEATDWVLDPENNAVKYKDPDALPDGGGAETSEHYVLYNNVRYYSPIDYCRASAADKSRTGVITARPDDANKNWLCYEDSRYFNQMPLKANPDYDPDAPAGQEKYISIDTVAAQVVANAEAGHVPSQEALRLSIIERVNIGEYDEALEAASIEIDTSWKYLPIYDVAVQVKRNSIAGHAESIEAVNNSLPFELPNYEPNITITGIGSIGEILTATVTDENGLPSNINYQWYADGEVIVDATSETYVIKESDSGKTVTVQVDFTDKDGFSESVTGAVDVENVAADIGLRADYSGSGWYKATDTGTVFNKGIPALETHVFSDSPTEYVSVYTKEDAKLYGERAAVSNITDMSAMFDKDASFNSDISSWDVSSVANMSSMFEGTTSFNQDLNYWDTSKVTDMYRMFHSATAFNQDMSMWDVSSVVTMEFMFYNATSFNQDISSWDVSSVANMNRMFNIASSYNQDLSKWCVSLIPTRPSYFDTSATAWTLPKPVWGTCPRGELG